MNKLLSILLYPLRRCAGGRPMTKIEWVFTDTVSGLAVNKYVDYRGRWWLANTAWSWFRVTAEPDLASAHHHSFKNATEIRKSAVCGCFHCLETFSPAAIRLWVSEHSNSTALCPYCDVDAVIGDASHYPITETFLRKMQLRWFNQSDEEGINHGWLTRGWSTYRSQTGDSKL